MDRSTKTAIKKLVLNLRHLLEDDIEVVLKRYGLFTDRDWLPTDEIPKADETILAARRRMEAAIGVEQARGMEPGEATRWYAREAAFTYLNRLAGLKCLEIRGLIDEVIATRVEYGGRSLFHRDFRHAHPDLAAQPDDGLPAALEAACRRVTDEMIGVLFDPDSESSVVWPRYQTLRQAIGLINDLPAEVWAEDEIIGWVYQFYNAEEKVRIRKRGKPKLPAEVAIINQFFTPRWVVKFLVDNTLGRLWLEMHPDSERVRTKCDYLVPEPLAIDDSRLTNDDSRLTNDDLRLTIDEPYPVNRKSEIVNPKSKINLDPNSPVNNSKAAPRRDPKPVTEIRLIDPACGTMHFGHYGFEVFQDMYRDARERGWPIQPGKTSAPTDAEVPTLILAHNLYGVDIDLRAVQLAALSLYMKAATAERIYDSRLTIDEPRPVNRESEIVNRKSKIVNLVCADARLTDGEVRARFLDAYKDDPALQKVWRALFGEMEDIAQVGSLLRVEERFRQLLQEYRPASVAPELDADRQLALDGVPQQTRQMGLAEVPGATAWSPRRTLTQMMAHLRRFARDALEEADVNAQLFAIEAEKTLGLLDVLLQDYDVVVMNPPYGGTTTVAKARLKSSYPDSFYDLCTAFITRAIEFVHDKGIVGSLTSRSFLYLSRLERFRRMLLDHLRVISILEMDVGLLDDATVRPCTSVFNIREGGTEDSPALFFNLKASDDWWKDFLRELQCLRKGITSPNLSASIQSNFLKIPNVSIAYWMSKKLVDIFGELPPFGVKGTEKDIGDTVVEIRQGMATGDDEKFVRRFWEVGRDSIGKRWVWFAKGGGYSTYYYDLDLILDWSDSAIEQLSQQGNRLPSREYYFREGLTYPATSEKGLSVRHLKPGAAPSVKGSGIYFEDIKNLWWVLAVYNSRLLEGLMRAFTVDREHQVGMMGRLPCKIPSLAVQERLEHLAREAYNIKCTWNTNNEICTCFTKPWLLQLAQPESDGFAQGLGRVVELLGDDASLAPPPPCSLAPLLNRAHAIETAADARLQQLQAQIDEAVYDLYEISPADRALIERELGNRPLELVWPQMERKSDQEKRREHVRRLLSYFILQAIKADQDGILPLVEHTGESTALDRLRERLEAAFGADVAFQMEDDAGRVLGKSVDKWLDKPFIQWHTRLYKRRPILWHIASPRGTFGALVYYHKLDRDTLPKVRNVYLRTLRDLCGTQLAQARSGEDHKTVDRLEAALDDLAVLDERLGGIIETGYDPVIDDGVKANILPLQEAGVLRQKKVV